MPSLSIRWPMLAAALVCATALAASLTLEQARTAVDSPKTDAETRAVAIERLAQMGTTNDVDRLAAKLADPDAETRGAATAALWRVWSRSGDPAIDALLVQGTEQMQSFAFAKAMAAFDEVIRRAPAFAEGWNKRATLRFLMGDYEDSLRDCDEVLKRNPKHFGALAGAGQNHVQLGHLEQAIDFYKRALIVNPYLPGPAASIIVLQRALQDKERNKI